MTIGKSITGLATRLVYGRPPTDVPPSLDSIELTRLNGSPFPQQEELAGKVVLFVNVASRCGLTPQYGALVDLAVKYRDRGFVIVGAPCNQFAGQEPGGAEDIAQFCAATYGVDFPLLAKLDVNGRERHPLYRWLIGSDAGGGNDISWNFEKFLVGRDAQVTARFDPKTKPDDARVVAAIQHELDQS